MPGIHCLVITMAAEPVPPGGTMMHVLLLLGQRGPEKSQNEQMKE